MLHPRTARRYAQISVCPDRRVQEVFAWKAPCFILSFFLLFNILRMTLPRSALCQVFSPFRNALTFLPRHVRHAYAFHCTCKAIRRRISLWEPPGDPPHHTTDDSIVLFSSAALLLPISILQLYRHVFHGIIFPAQSITPTETDRLE